ncbi:EAL domain-containing protein [Burkholderia diffusa]|uniref:EAL domain-containing protein n=1 Tax=Burkholderia diffusa TaxID=488732 RepID=UPI0018C88D05|nr:EAL domain-containing protein [Burkholderia diffusa]
MKDQLHRRAQQLCGLSVVTSRVENDSVTIGLKANPDHPLESGAVDDAGHLELLLALLWEPGAKFPLLNGMAILVPQCVEESGCTKHAPCALRILAPAISVNPHLSSDITVAMHVDRSLISFQPIRAVRDTGRDLYRARTVRVLLVSSPDVLLRPRFMPKLERTSREREFDKFVVGRLIERLGMDPVVDVGYTINATSATSDASWSSIFEAQADDANIASRLVFAIDEAALLTWEGAWSFANRRRQFGCWLAVNHFGVQRGAFTAAEFVGVNIIKISLLLPWRARDSAHQATRLADMLVLARVTAMHVMVDEVLPTAHLYTAALSSAAWPQGPWLGAPAALRSDGPIEQRWAERYA